MYGYGYRYNSGLVVGAGGGGFTNTYSLDYDGVDDYVSTSGNSILNGGTELTVSAWINTADKTKTQIITSTFFGSKYVEMSLISGGLYCWIGNGTSTSNYNVVNSTNLAINNSTWYNFTMVFDGSQPTNDTRLKVYKDGSLLTWTTVRTIPTTLATDLTLNTNIGARNGGTSFSGKIDEVAYWHSLENPLDIYNSGTPTDLTSLSPVAWYRFEEGMGTTAIDSGSGGNNGTLINGVVYSTDIP